MGLSLGVRVGTTIYVGDVPVKVKILDAYKSATLEVQGHLVKVFDDKAVEILPAVFVQCGQPSERVLEAARARGKSADIISRLVIDAPRDITILRKKLYHGQTRVQNSNAGDRKGAGQRNRGKTPA